MKVSLWLIPEDRAFAQIEKQIQTYASRGTGPVFTPHITVVGGVVCPDQASLTALEEGLRKDLAHHPGAILCEPENDQPAFMVHKETGKPVWNQAAAIPIRHSEHFLALHDICTRVISLAVPASSSQSTSSSTSHIQKRFFPPPLGRAHISLYYGERDVPTELEAIPPFLAKTLAVWETEPSTPEGVPRWTRIFSVPLSSSSSSPTR